MRRRRRVHGARLCTSERERAVDPERPGTAPPASPVGHRPNAPPPAVLAVVDPAEDRGWTSDAPRGDGVMAVGATERESAGRGGARSALQHRRHSRLSPHCAPRKNKMKKSGLSRNPGHPVVASGVEGRSFAGRMRSRRGREVSLVRSRDSGAHPSEPRQGFERTTQINSSVAPTWPVCLCRPKSRGLSSVVKSYRRPLRLPS